jgi:macrolide transport system ATP-binding/permease protein
MMRLLTILSLRIRSLVRRSAIDDELAAELRDHIERQVAHDVAAGRDPAAARRAALATIGGLTQATEECREMRGLNVLESIQQDVRYAVRQFRRAPLFAGTAVVLLMLGMWASISIFTFVNAALIQPLPYAQPSRLVAVFGRTAQFPRSNLSYLDYLDLKERNQVFESFSALQGGGAALTTVEGTERITAPRVTDDFFRTLGVVPMLGRDFSAGEDRPGAPATIILSYSAWMTRFAGAADVLGRRMLLNNEPHLIVGVLPASFKFAPVEPAEVWRTLRGTNGCDRNRGCHNLTAIARLRAGITVDAAAVGLELLARQLALQFPETNGDQGTVVMPMTKALLANTEPILATLLVGAALLLLIAAVNVASLLLVRSVGRQREFSVRTALGASAARVARQFVTEGLLLVTVATILALIAVHFTTGALTSLMPPTALARFWYLQLARPGPTVYLFACGVALGAAVLFTALPLSQLPIRRGMQIADGGRGASGLAWRRLGSRLVAVELILATVLLVGAGLLAKSVYKMLTADIGMEPERLALVQVTLPGSKYSQPEQIVAFARDAIDRIAALPDVQSAAVSSTAPLLGGNTSWIRIGGRPFNGEHNEVHYRQVSAEYLATLDARLIRGRVFDRHDDASAPGRVIVNQALVRVYFPGEDPIGKQLFYLATTSKPMDIIGIVQDVKESPIDKDTPPTIYTAFAQEPTTGFVVVARAAQNERALLPLMAAEIRRMDAGVVAHGARTMSDVIDQAPATYTRRAAAWLAGGFAFAAWLLAVVGLYGVVAFSVGQRTREIGVRMALGAGRTSVLTLVLSEAGRLIALGTVAGLAAAIGAGTLMRGLLFEVQAWDLSTLAWVACALSASALVASYVPARRAASVNPTEALRAE